MFGARILAPAILIIAVIALAVPAASVVMNTLGAGKANDSDHDFERDLVTISGTVTAILYDDWEDEQDDDIDDADDADDDEDDLGDDDDEMEDDEDDDAQEKMRVCGFVVDDNVTVEIGPWWYWMSEGINITDLIHVGDVVNVTGEWEDESVFCAWSIDNLTTGEKLTIKEEGRPPWAGGPKAHGIDPWPPSDEDD